MPLNVPTLVVAVIALTIALINLLYVLIPHEEEYHRFRRALVDEDPDGRTHWDLPRGMRFQTPGYNFDLDEQRMTVSDENATCVVAPQHVSVPEVQLVNSRGIRTKIMASELGEEDTEFRWPAQRGEDGQVLARAGHGTRWSNMTSAEVTLENGSIFNRHVNVAANIATSKLSGALTDITGHGLGALGTKDTINNNDWNGTDLAVIHGGTGASTAANAATNLGLGTGNSPTFTGLNLSAPLLTPSTVDGRDVSADGTQLDTLWALGLSALTSDEVDQLENIGATTISAAQWAYLGALDQALTQASSPTFVGLTLSDALVTSSTVDGRDVSADGTQLDTLWALGLSALTSDEVDQLENIGATTISAAQWAYLGALDQALTQASDVTFNTVDGRDVSADGGQLDTLWALGLSALTSDEVDQLENIGATTISAAQWAYLGALDQALTQASSPTFVGLTLSDALVTSSTVDGRDVSADGGQLDTLWALGLSALTSDEVDQLENIGATTISAAQWAYLGALDQALTQASSPTFVGLTLSDALVTSSTVDGRDVSADGATLDTLDALGLSALTSDEVDQLENIGATTISAAQWAYLGALDQALTQASSPTFVGATLSGATASRLLATDGAKAMVSSDLVNWVAGTAGEVTVADDGSGGVTLSAPTCAAAITEIQKAFIGSFVESFDALVTSDGATVTMSLEAGGGGGNLTMNLSTGQETLNCTPAATIELTAGTVAVPTTNYIYVPLATKVLTVSTVSWPSTEHIKVAFILVPTAAYVAADGPFINQNWNDHIADNTPMGHLQHITEHMRAAGAIYHSGCDLTTTEANGSTLIAVTSGVIYQLHKHAFTAKDMATGDDVHIKNHSVTPNVSSSNLYDDITADSTGSAILNNRYFNIVIWGTGNKTGEYSPLFCNLPAGDYKTQQQAEEDSNGYDDFTMPREYTLDSATGFLIARLTYQMGNTWVLKSTVDLRGQTPTTAAGGVTGTVHEFADGLFRVYDTTDNSKELAFECSGITISTTRTMTIPDADGTLVLDTAGLSALTSDEVDQLENIGATTISAAQWGYLGALDQSVASTDSPTFANVTISGAGTVDGRDVSADGGQLDTLWALGLSALTSDEVDQLENIGATTISAAQWAYLGALDQDVHSTSTPTFANTTRISGSSTNTVVDHADSDWLNLRNTSVTANAKWGIIWSLQDAFPRLAGITIDTVYGSGDANLDFNTRNSSGTYATRMTLTNDGALGIGTTGPDAKLDVLSTAGAQLRLTYTDGSVYTDFTTDSNGYLTIAPSGGRVGIGMTPTTYDLEIDLDSQAWGGAIYLAGDGTGAKNWRIDNTNNSHGQGGGKLLFRENGAGAYIFNIDGANARVGIGTTGPDAKLDVLDTAGAQLRLTYTDGSVYTDFTTDSSGNLFADNTGAVMNFRSDIGGGSSNTWYKFRGNSGGSSFTINVYARTQLRADTGQALSLTSDGSSTETDGIYITTAHDVGIGTSGPDAKLDVLSTAGAQLRLTYTDGSVYTDFTTNSSGDLLITPSGTDVLITNGSLWVAGGGASNDYTDGANQLVMAYDSGVSYAHAIRTRHHSGQDALNAIDFYVWDYGDAATTVGGKRVMTLDGDSTNGCVSIGGLPQTGRNSKLQVHGTNESINDGPNLGLFTDSDGYPLLNIFCWSHDNVYLNFDAYYDGAWRSSDAGSNFQINKLSDQLRFQYDSGIAAGSELSWNNGIALDTAGNVGIGTTGPDAKLDSLSTAGAQLRLTYTDNSVYTDFETNSAGELTITPSAGIIKTNGSAIELNAAGSGNRYAYIDFHGDDTYTDYAFRIIRNNSGTNAQTGMYHLGTGNFILQTSHAASMVFCTSGATRMVIDANGKIGMGAAPSGSYLLELNADSAGKPSSSTWAIVSDRRIKRDIVHEDTEQALEIIEGLQPATYCFNEHYRTACKLENRRYYGFIADEVEPVLPTAVREAKCKMEYDQTAESPEPDAYCTVKEGKVTFEIPNCKTFDSNDINVLAVAAIKELAKQVRALSDRVATLEGT